MAISELWRLRISAGMSQGKLSNETGISRWRISQAEIGNLELTKAEMKRILAAVKGEPARLRKSIDEELETVRV